MVGDVLCLGRGRQEVEEEKGECCEKFALVRDTLSSIGLVEKNSH